MLKFVHNFLCNTANLTAKNSWYPLLLLVLVQMGEENIPGHDLLKCLHSFRIFGNDYLDVVRHVLLIVDFSGDGASPRLPPNFGLLLQYFIVLRRDFVTR